MPRISRMDLRVPAPPSQNTNLMAKKSMAVTGKPPRGLQARNGNIAVPVASSGTKRKAAIISENTSTNIIGKSIKDGETKAPAAKKRAALGEITNAFNETTKNAKKGLTKMLNTSKTKLNSGTNFVRQASLRSSNRLKNQKSDNSKKSQHTEEEDPDFLNSSQDTEVVISNLPPSNENSTISKVEIENAKLGFIDSDDESFESAEGESDERTVSSTEEQICRRPSSPQKPELPEGVYDFDGQNRNDPNQCSEYVMETFAYYKQREEMFMVPDYMGKVQTEITPAMRAILVDWLVEVQESFELNHETLYSAVKIVDIYLSKVHSKKEDLQLIGAVAALISCKIDERIPPLLDDFVCVCGGAYRKSDIRAKELEMFGVVGFDLGFPQSYRFLRRYGRVCMVTMPVLTYARYILESALMEYTLNVETSESLLATAALIVTFKIKGIEGWRETLEYYSGYSVDRCKPLVKRLHQMLLKPSVETKKTIRIKYSHSVFHEVAKTPVPEELDFN